MYDDFSDRLMISCKKPLDKIKGSVRILNLVLDFNNENKVVNIELRKASDYLESLSINPLILKKLSSADLVLNQCRDGYIIYFILQSGELLERIPYNIQTKKVPLLN